MAPSHCLRPNSKEVLKISIRKTSLKNHFHMVQWVNTLGPRQNGWHFPDDIFKCFFVNENVWMSLKISALVQIMAWRRLGNKPLSSPLMVNYANPVYDVATIYHQVGCLRWGHPSLFHTATSLLIWYEMFSMRDISYRLTWMKFINMLSVYAQSGMHRCVNWWIITVLT